MQHFSFHRGDISFYRNAFSVESKTKYLKVLKPAKRLTIVAVNGSCKGLVRNSTCDSTDTLYVRWLVAGTGTCLVLTPYARPPSCQLSLTARPTSVYNSRRPAVSPRALGCRGSRSTMIRDRSQRCAATRRHRHQRQRRGVCSAASASAHPPHPTEFDQQVLRQVYSYPIAFLPAVRRSFVRSVGPSVHASGKYGARGARLRERLSQLPSNRAV
jgi:hypothetical protein